MGTISEVQIQYPQICDQEFMVNNREIYFKPGSAAEMIFKMLVDHWQSKAFAKKTGLILVLVNHRIQYYLHAN